MLKNTFFILLLVFYTSVVNAQKTKLPKGYDKITLDGKPAYMNLITGEVSYNIPKITARKISNKKIKEYIPFKTHIVQKGETLYKIARKHNISIQKIYKINNSDANDHLFVGQEIIVGFNKNQKTNVPVLNKKMLSSVKYHIVKPNENLYRISLKHHLKLFKLKKLNNLTSNIIFVGQKLIIQ